MRWLVVGALRVEVSPLLWRLRDVETLSPRFQHGQHPQHPTVQVGVLRCGVGPQKAYDQTVQALSTWAPDAIVSMGTCGALHDALQIGDIRTARSLFEDQVPVPNMTPFPHSKVASVTTVDRPCWTPERRHELRQTGADLVEMEAAAVARAGRDCNPSIPVHALKVVSDQAGGSPDTVFRSNGIPTPLHIMRFKFRALKLCHHRLVPALLPLLTESG